MKRKPLNQGKTWDQNDIKQLIELRNGNTPTRLIAYKLKRTEGAVRSKASDLSISLKPVNQSPYNR